jgi:hypothetical protein
MIDVTGGLIALGCIAAPSIMWAWQRREIPALREENAKLRAERADWNARALEAEDAGNALQRHVVAAAASHRQNVVAIEHRERQLNAKVADEKRRRKDVQARLTKSQSALAAANKQIVHLSLRQKP